MIFWSSRARVWNTHFDVLTEISCCVGVDGFPLTIDSIRKHSMAQTLFKYTDAKTAELILQNRRLRWKAPELFNDPFEFKSPLEFGFEWEDLELHLVEEFTRLVTQSIETELVEGGPTTREIREFRTEYTEKRPHIDHVRAVFRQLAAILTRRQREKDLEARKLWRRKNREYRVDGLPCVSHQLV